MVPEISQMKAIRSALLPVLSSTLPVIDELAKRLVRFVQKCLSSDRYVVRFIASMVCVSDVCIHRLGMKHFLLFSLLVFNR